LASGRLEAVSRVHSQAMSVSGAVRALRVDLRPLRESRDYRLLWSGLLVSVFGRQVSTVAVLYQVYLLTGSTFAIGLLAIARLVPLVAGSLVAGVVVDRFDRRLVLLGAQVPRVGCTAALAALAPFHPPIWIVFALAMTITLLSTFDQTARSAIIPNIVSREALPGAMALNLGIFHLTNVSGPAIGGIVLALFGLTPAYIIDAAGTAIGLVAVLLMSRQAPNRDGEEHPVAAVRTGLRFVRNHRVILGAFSVDLTAMVFGLPRALFPVLALHVYHGGAIALGLLYAAPSVGGVVAILTSGWLRHVRRLGRVYVLGELVWGAAIAVAGLSSVLWPVLILLAIAGGADAAGVACSSTILQLETPDHLRGRLNSAYSMVVGGGPYLGDFESGAAAAIAGPQIAFVFGGAMCVGLGLVLIRVFPLLWGYLRPQDDVDVAGSGLGVKR
jgi:MFS family permease